MAEKEKTSKAPIIISVGAAIMAAIAMAREAKAAEPGEPGEPGGPVVLPKELWNILAAIAASANNVDNDLDAVIEELSKLSISMQGWPPNAEGTRSFAVICPVVNIPYHVPDMEVPDGMALAIKASPLNAVGSLIRVARTPAEATNPNSSWPLVPNEPITYHVKNANIFHVSSNIAGSMAIFTSEQR